jgi:glycosyltransferase involved in cell wall biosynthesis
MFDSSSVRKLSVIVITLNEKNNIEDCLLSVRDIADEIIVVDSGSIDGTQTIARNAGAQVFDVEWLGDGEQRNIGIGLARNDWILNLDADERVSDSLCKEIKKFLHEQSDYDVFSIPRLSIFCGKRIRHSGWWPDRIFRLFNRKKAKFSSDIVHAGLRFKCASGQLSHPLIHYTVRNIAESVDKMNRYSSQGAHAAIQHGKRSSLGQAITRALWTFFRTYIIRRGFLDGTHGLMIAIANAEGTYYKYLKIRLSYDEEMTGQG